MTKTTHADLERRLRELFSEQHHAVKPSEPTSHASATLAPVDLDSQRVGIRRRIGVAALALAATAAMVAAVLAIGGRDSAVKVESGVGGSGPSNGSPQACADAVPPYRCSGSIQWNTPQVRLDGTSFSILTEGTAGAQTFTADEANVIVHSDPGDAAYQTLELEWLENGVEQRWYIYFESDGKDWWASEMRTYDGQSPASDWVYFEGPHFRTPLGSAWSGDLDLTASDHGVKARLRMRIAHLQAFLSRDPATNVTPPTTAP
jgi:hypothetical protein